MEYLATLGGLALLATTAGCGGNPGSSSTTQPPAGHAVAERSPISAVPPAVSASAAQDPDEDGPDPAELKGVPPEHQPAGEKGMISLNVLLPVPDPSPPGGFPTATIADKDCARSIGLLGQLDKDFASITSACGDATGMKEYGKAVTGKIYAGHSRDTFQVKLAGGYCYRFFAVADGSITKLGFRVHRDNGALHSVILGKQPVIIYRPTQPWCRRRDRDFQFVVETLEGGEGRYAFGIWARPNPRGRAK